MGQMKKTNMGADLLAYSSYLAHSNLALPCFEENVVRAHKNNNSTLQIFWFVWCKIDFECYMGNKMNQTKKSNPKQMINQKNKTQEYRSTFIHGT